MNGSTATANLRKRRTLFFTYATEFLRNSYGWTSFLRTFATDNGDTGTEERICNAGDHALVAFRIISDATYKMRLFSVACRHPTNAGRWHWTGNPHIPRTLLNGWRDSTWRRMDLRRWQSDATRMRQCTADCGLYCQLRLDSHNYRQWI